MEELYNILSSPLHANKCPYSLQIHANLKNLWFFI